MTEVTATLTEIRADHMQKWERTELSKNDQVRYIWLALNQSKPNLTLGTVATLVFVKTSGGHWSGWRVQ